MRDIKFIPCAYIDVPFHHIASHLSHSFKIGWDGYVHPRSSPTFTRFSVVPHILVDRVPIRSVHILKSCQYSHGRTFCWWASPTFPLPCSSFPNLPMFPMGRNYVSFPLAPYGGGFSRAHQILLHPWYLVWVSTGW
jgi:hypothetical protein